MKKMKLVLFVTISISVLSTSCDKPITVTNTEILTQAKWVLVKYEKQTGTAPWQDLFPALNACDKDDTTIFRPTGFYDVIGGPVKCDPLEPSVLDTEAWRFTDNETKMFFDGYTDPFNIDNLGPTRFVITTFPKDIGGGVTEKIRSTYNNVAR
jgi:hypothetical protein